MEIIRKHPKEVHAYIPELKDQYRQGRISRREFLRTATLLGMSFTGATAFLAACGPTAAPAPTAAPTAAAAPTQAPAPTQPPAPTATVAAAGPTRGGKLMVASFVMKVTHPAQFSWVSPSNQLRQVAEYLTVTDRENITHPWLLEKWQASDDLKTWTLNLLKGVKHNNGDEFNADDVIFTMNEWMNPDVGSSMLGLIGEYLKPEGIEKVDDYTVVLHLDRAEIGVPEHLFHYPALVLNSRTFEGDFLKAPHGTGPYTLESYSEGERALLKARTDYYRNGADGKPLPYLDEMEFIDMGQETSAWTAALKAGEVDYIDNGDLQGPEMYLALRDDPNISVTATPTAITGVLRMRVDLDPWKDNRVRQALKLCQNREKILNLAYFGEGLQAQDFHVYPGHPEYCEMPIPAIDTEKAKQLLADAGYPNGIDITLAVGSGWSDVVSYAEALKEDAAAAGFNITLNSMPTSQYWEQWTEVDLGITPWTHRPLGTMVLNLAYIADAQGKPVPWNETRWTDPEFSELLIQANGTLDVEERRKIFCKLETIQQERGSIGIAYWTNTWLMHRKNIMGTKAHPTNYMFMNDVWKEA